MLGKSIPNVQKAIVCWSEKIRKMPIKSTAMRFSAKTKRRLSPITLLPLINLRPKPLRSVKKIGGEVFQPLGSMPLRLRRITRIRLRT